LTEKFGPPKSSPALITTLGYVAVSSATVEPMPMPASVLRPAGLICPVNDGPYWYEKKWRRPVAKALWSVNCSTRSFHVTWRISVPGHAPTDSGSTHPVSTVGLPMIDETYATVPSGSTPNAASPRPLGRNTNSAPGANVVEVVVEVDVEVVDVEVDVGAAVVTGIVVVVVAGAVLVVVSATDVDVEPVSTEAALLSLQPAAIIAKRITGRRRVGFTGEVWHAASPLPDQGVCFVTTFNKL